MSKAVDDRVKDAITDPSWPRVRLRDVAEIKLGKMLDATDTSGRELPYLRNINVQWGRIDNSDLKSMYFETDEVEDYSLRPGDILVCEGGEPGRAAICGESEAGMLYQKALHRVRPSAQLEPRWLLYNLKLDATSGQLSDLFTGTTIKHLTLSKFQEYEIPLPPLPTQHRIAATLDTLTSHAQHANDYLTAIPPLIDKFRQSVLARAFTGELTADWRKNNPDVEPASQLLERIKVERRKKWIENYARKLADRARKRNQKKGKPFTDDDWQAYFDKKVPQGEKRYEEPEPVDPEKEDLPEIPETWEWVAFEEVVFAIRNGISTAPNDQTGLPVLRISAVRPMELDLSDVRYLDASPKAHGKFQLREGDVLVTRYNGNPRYVGACAVVSHLPRTTYFPDKLMRVRLPKALVLPRLFAMMMSTGVTRQAISQRVKSAAGQKGISQTDLQRIPIPLPPVEEQRAIVEDVDDQLGLVHSSEITVERAEARLTVLRSSILSTVLCERS